ncbi:uncharacterized protein RHTO_07200 [Rhodotorula toruloides NP11]|uniref:Uncharacterized protein n=1 Tax=Rhodotorula toruloides (strain NP11) TaxID=1130832 RepID=M7WZE6_RHOT1|nr:uncharacterized protein RHTO_07200 [Rhodotorula toruloides NP11]EMS23466.1 hypothetical protein RHTO_07200 [Rhodotorula toruloides NP11]
MNALALWMDSRARLVVLGPRTRRAQSHGRASREVLPEAAALPQREGCHDLAQGCWKGPQVVQGGRSRLQDPPRGHRGHLHRQEVPLHRPRLDSRPHPHRQGHLDQDDPHHHHPPRVPPLCPQVLEVREAPQERCRPLLARVPCRGRRHRHRRPVPPLVEDRPLQRSSRGRSAPEGLLQVLGRSRGCIE